jgi:glycosyltransferase involved in cell wall biosynthesis
VAKLKVALLGTRGVPASYSGFETCVEQLGSRLAAKGHDVTVYCRSHHIDYEEDVYKGMKLVKLPTLPTKHLDTIVHTFLSTMHTLTRRYDVALYFGVGNALLTWIPRLAGTRTILNVDGLDWKRDKWSWPAKKYLQLCEYLSALLPNVQLTDSVSVQDSYYRMFGHKPRVISYGSDVDERPPGEVLERFGLKQKEYILFVGRLVPENRVHHLIDAYMPLDTSLKCVIVGDAAYATDYISELKAKAAGNPNIIFTGYVFGDGYLELGSNALIFAGTSGVGGTHPAVLEAMGFGQCVIVNDTRENLETIGDAGVSYSGTEGATSLRDVLATLIRDPDRIQDLRQRARERAERVFSWDAVTLQYEGLIHEIAGVPLDSEARSRRSTD